MISPELIAQLPPEAQKAMLDFAMRNINQGGPPLQPEMLERVFSAAGPSGVTMHGQPPTPGLPGGGTGPPAGGGPNTNVMAPSMNRPPTQPAPPPMGPPAPFGGEGGRRPGTNRRPGGPRRGR